MPKTRRSSRRSHRMRSRSTGGGYQTAQQFFTPSNPQPSASLLAPVVTTAPTATEIRPVLYSTFQAGAGRKTRSGRRTRGGFSPSVMGSFIANAQAAIVPLALYAVYHTAVPKRGASAVGGRKSLRAARKSLRAARKSRKAGRR
jgi:hypothetical protein